MQHGVLHRPSPATPFQGRLYNAPCNVPGVFPGAFTLRVSQGRNSACTTRQQPVKVCSVLTKKAPARTAGTLKLARRGTNSRVLEQAERTLLAAIRDVKGRGKGGLAPEQQAAFDQALAVLEADGGVPAATRSGLLEGRWRLVFTTRPGSASPIQRSFTGVDAFSVFQEIQLDAPGGARVNNIVDFGSSVGELKVEAEAVTDSQPRPRFTPRKGAGLPLFGKSATYPAARPDMRIDFQFDKAAFAFRALPFKIPYPVPFKLLGDETKGWIDITYLARDGSLRVARGNKGTVFVLSRDVPLREQLLRLLDQAAPADDQVEQLAEQLVAQGGGTDSPATSPVIEGRWRQRWSRQAEDANPLQKRFSGRSFQLVGGEEAGEGRVENLVQLGPALRLRACAAAAPASPTRTSVDIQELRVELGPLKLALPLRTTQAAPGWVDWLYVDDELRITRGNKGSLFIHTRAD